MCWKLTTYTHWAFSSSHGFSNSTRRWDSVTLMFSVRWTSNAEQSPCCSSACWIIHATIGRLIFVFSELPSEFIQDLIHPMHLCGNKWNKPVDWLVPSKGLWFSSKRCSRILSSSLPICDSSVSREGASSGRMDDNSSCRLRRAISTWLRYSSMTLASDWAASTRALAVSKLYRTRGYGFVLRDYSTPRGDTTITSCDNNLYSFS